MSHDHNQAGLKETIESMRKVNKLTDQDDVSQIQYISTSSTTSTLRLPLYILSAVDAYQKACGTGKNVMVMMVMMVQGTYVL